MAKRRSEQQWQALFQQYDDSALTKQAFCQQNDIPLSTFFSKRRKRSASIKALTDNHQHAFLRAEIIPQHASNSMISSINSNQTTTNMTLRMNNIELNLPCSTPAAYLAELIRALSL